MKTELAGDGWPSAEQKTKSIAQATALREQARAGGLRFDAYLAQKLADWLLGIIEEGGFIVPGEAALQLSLFCGSIGNWSLLS